MVQSPLVSLPQPEISQTHKTIARIAVFKNKTILAYSALAAGILCLSFSGLFVRWANAPGVVTSFFRMTIAAMVMSPFLFRQAKPVTGQGQTFPWSATTGRSPRELWPRGGRAWVRGVEGWVWLLPAALGGLFTALDHGAWTTSMGLTSVANATLLNNTAPIWVALVAYFVLKEKLKRYFWLGLLLTMAGATVVLASDLIAHPTLGWGDLIALGSGLFYAAYFLVTQRARQSMSAFTYMAVVDLVSALFLLSFCLLFNQPLTGYPLQTYLIFIAAALVSQVIGHLSLSYALGHLPASLVAPTMIAQPILTALLAIPLLGEALHPTQWTGGLAVLTGIYLVNLSQET